MASAGTFWSSSPSFSSAGFFAAAEMALVSLREGQVQRAGQARQARPAGGPARARPQQVPVRGPDRRHGGDPAVRGLRCGDAGRRPQARRWFRMLSPHVAATVVAFVVVTLVIAFFSLVLGELAPKRIALQRQERISLAAAPVLDRIAALASPVVWLLVGLRQPRGPAARRRPEGRPAASMTSEELRDLVAGHQNAQRRRAAHRQRGLRRGQAADPRGAGAADRGRVPVRRRCRWPRPRGRRPSARTRGSRSTRTPTTT